MYLESSDVSYYADTGSDDRQEMPLSAAEAVLALARIHLRANATLTEADSHKASQFLKAAEILSVHAIKTGAAENNPAQMSGQAVSKAVKAIRNLAEANVPVEGESVAKGNVAAGSLDKNVAALASGKPPIPNKTGGTEIYTAANAKINTKLLRITKRAPIGIAEGCRISGTGRRYKIVDAATVQAARLQTGPISGAGLMPKFYGKRPDGGTDARQRGGASH